MKDRLAVGGLAAGVVVSVAAQLLIYAAVFVILVKLAFGWFGGF